MDFPLVLSQELFPVQVFFNMMPARSFLRTLEGFSRGVGAGFDDAFCEFPHEIDADEEGFDGVRFYISDESVVIANVDFNRCLNAVSKMYMDMHPEDADSVADLLGKIASRTSE